jgi:hypothetical protein
VKGDRFGPFVTLFIYRSHSMLFSNGRSPLLAHFSAAIAGIGKIHFTC